MNVAKDPFSSKPSLPDPYGQDRNLTYGCATQRDVVA